MGRSIGKADGARSEQGGESRGYASKGDRGKLQETLLEESPLGRRATNGAGGNGSDAVHGSVWNVLELCGKLAFQLPFYSSN